MHKENVMQLTRKLCFRAHAALMEWLTAATIATLALALLVSPASARTQRRHAAIAATSPSQGSSAAWTNQNTASAGGDTNLNPDRSLETPGSTKRLTGHAVPLAWRTRAGMPTARAAPASAVSGGRIYVLGGFTSGLARALRVAEVYDPKTDDWRAIAPLPVASAMLGAASVAGRVFAIGGLNTNFESLSVVQQYDPSTRQWQREAPLPVAAGEITATAHDGLIYAVGGVTTAGRSLARLQIYHPDTNKWTRGAPMPTARGLAQSTWSGGQLYVIGGVTGPDETRVGTVEAYNPRTNRWRTLAPLPIPRAHPAVGTIDGNRIIVAGGGIATHENLSSVEIFTPARNSWQPASGLKRADSGGPTGAVLAGNRFYVIGGLSGTNVRAINSVQSTTVK